MKYLLSVFIGVHPWLILSAADKPNIVFVLADDLGSGDLGCYGCPDIKTPNVDKLAAQGVRFTRFYANGPECSPTRAALLTGRYQHRVGGLECAIGLNNVGRYDDADRLAKAHDLGLPADRAALAPLLKKAGYATACVGKWHLGYEPKFGPTGQGFDHWFGPIGGGTDYFRHTEPGGGPVLYLNGRLVERDGYLTDLLTADAVRFVAANKARPFFLYLPYNAPHSPFQGPADMPAGPVSLADSEKGSREKVRAMVERLDQGVGAVLAALNEAGVAGKTIVIFTSDNGGPKFARNAPLSGGKGTTMEGGIRVPCVARWPGVLPAGVTDDRVGVTFDLTASLVRAAGAEPPADKPFDGIDVLRDAAEGKPAAVRTLFWRGRRGDKTWKAVRDGNLKYVSQQTGADVQEYVFDLAADESERTNLLAKGPADAERLKALLAAWEAEVRPTR